jgi:hypothetical protein
VFVTFGRKNVSAFSASSLSLKDWIRVEDYRRDVERLEKLLRDNGIDF